MAEIQAAISAKFLQVANAHQPTRNEDGDSLGPLVSFFGVLESQLSKQVGSADLKLPELSLSSGLPDASASESAGESVEMPAQTVTREAAVPTADGGTSQASDPVVALSAATSASRDATQPSVALAAAGSLLMSGMKPEMSVSRAASTASTLNKTGPDVTDKLAGSTKSSGLSKSSGAAMAAVSGQTLPHQVQSGQGGASATDAKGEALLAAMLSPQTGARGEAGIAAPISGAVPIALTHSFEQVLRQAEAKINATIEAPLRSPGFATELSEKVVWLVGRQGQFAELSLNPPQLGSLEVRLSLTGGEASAQFFSANPVVREAIDAALPKLRELMAQAGINLGEAEVRDQAFDGRHGADARARNRAVEGDAPSHQAVMAGMNVIRPDGSGLVDLYI
jgi:flagellar hook-length control protein FliK